MFEVRKKGSLNLQPENREITELKCTYSLRFLFVIVLE